MRDTSKLNYFKRIDLPITFKLKSLPEKTAYKLLFDYFIRDRLFNLKYDFHRILTPLSDDMYYSKSNAVPAEIIVSKSSKKFRISKSIKTFEMKKDFIARLDHKGYSEIFIPYHLIKECLHELLDKESQAIIWMSIYQKRFENVKFSKGVKSKAKVSKIEKGGKHIRGFITVHEVLESFSENVKNL